MKLNYIVILVFLLCLSHLQGLWISESKTINAFQLSSLRDSSINFDIDSLPYSLWHTYNLTVKNDSISVYDPSKEYSNTFGFESRALGTFINVVNDNQTSLSIPDDYTWADSVRTYLDNFNWHDFKLAIYNPMGVSYNYQNTYGWSGNWANLSTYDRGRELCFSLLFYAMTIDLLYYGSTSPAEQTQMDSILVDLADMRDWAYRTFLNHDPAEWDSLGWQDNDLVAQPVGYCVDYGPVPQLPEIAFQVNRVHLLSFIGYACLLTDDYSLLDEIRQEFKSDTNFPLGSDCFGLNDYLTTDSGMYSSGLTYQNRVFYLGTLFFDALDRMGIVNLYNESNAWNCDVIPRMIRATLRRIDPELHHILQEDDWRYDGFGVRANNTYYDTYDNSKKVERGLINYYYHNTDDPETRENIRWYIMKLKEKNGGDYPLETWEHDMPSSFCAILGYMQGDTSSPVIHFNSSTPSPPLPSFIANGNYSDSELTILRDPINTGIPFELSDWMVINHEHSFAMDHWNGDATSYQLYLRGKPAIIESGYKQYNDGDLWLPWMRSPYSHNMIIVNPGLPIVHNEGDTGDAFSSEDSYLGILPTNPKLTPPPTLFVNYEDPYPQKLRFWYGFQNNALSYENPPRKGYLSTTNSISHLNLRMKYNNNVSNSFPSSLLNVGNVENDNYPCTVERNYYSMGDGTFVVFDRISQIRHYENIYRNQIHLLSYEITPQKISQQTGYFSYDVDNGATLIYDVNIGMGSTLPGSLMLRNNLPLGWRAGDWYGETPMGPRKHMSRIYFQTDRDLHPPVPDIGSFITTIIPTDYYTNPTIVSNTGYTGYWWGYKPGSGSGNRLFVGVQEPNTAGINFTDLDNTEIHTDGEFFFVEYEPSTGFVDRAVLNRASYMNIVNSSTSLCPISVLEADDTGIEEWTVEWANGSIEILYKSDTLTMTKYRVLRQNSDPCLFQSRCVYYPGGVPPEENDDYDDRSSMSHSYTSLAYDDMYFYVNYSFSDLVSAGCDDGDLVIVKGVIPGHTRIANLGVEGCVSVTGMINISSGAQLSITKNSDISFSDSAGIINSGSLYIKGLGSDNPVYLRNASVQWIGLRNHSYCDLYCENAVIDGAEIGIDLRGTGTIKNCLIKLCNEGITITNSNSFEIQGNIIRNCGTGIYLANVVLPGGSASITNNQIYNNDTGITCYNSSPKISENNIHHNSNGGAVLISESCPIIKGNLVCNSGSSSATSPEIALEAGSYPIIDDGCNDINSDGAGYSIVYNVGVLGLELKLLNARNNFWSYTTEQEILNTTSPSYWTVKVVPFCTLPNTPFYIPEDPFKMALKAEDEGKLGTASGIFMSIVTSSPDSLIAVQSLGRLINIYAISDTLTPDIRSVFGQYYANCSDSLNIKSAEHLEIMIDRIDGEYPSALNSYEQLLDNSYTESDSLIYLLDIAYTIEEMLYDESNKSENTGVSYINHGLNIDSKESARSAIRLLLSRLVSNSRASSGSVYATSPIVKVSNYPNPFNPTTIINYSMPRQDRITISVYNIKGQWIKDLVDTTQLMGNHSVIWDGLDANGRSVGSGIYFIRAKASGRCVIHKIMLLK